MASSEMLPSANIKRKLRLELVAPLSLDAKAFSSVLELKDSPTVPTGFTRKLINS